jgi:peptidoglycan lytic transglycosylase
MESHRRKHSIGHRQCAATVSLWILLALTYMAPACSGQSAPAAQVAARRSVKAEAATGTSGVSRETRTGRASFIASSLNGRTTASGEPYDGTELVAAHPSYPLGTILRVTNQENGRVVEVKVVDRTGSPAARRYRMIDLSHAAAERLDFVTRGTAPVTTEVLQWGDRRTRR